MTENNRPVEIENQWKSVAQDQSILGFNPHTDAIRQSLHNGIRIWYYRNDQLRWVSRTNGYQDRWRSPTTTTTEDAANTLSAAEEIEVIDKTLFNNLASHVDLSRESVHDGLMWGLVFHHGRSLRKGDVPYGNQLQYVPGIGESTASSILRALSGYEGIEGGEEDG